VTPPSHLLLRDGRQITTRRADDTDRDAILALYEGLSERSRYQRFFHPTPRLTAELRDFLTDLDRADVWLAFDGDECVGESRISPYPDGERADLAMTVADRYHRKGIGRHLVRAAVGAGRHRHRELTMTILPDNTAAIRLARGEGIALRFERGVVEGVIPQEVPTMSKFDSKIGRLAEIDLFRVCKPRQLHQLARLTTELDAVRGTVLCREGETGREWFVVRDGEATVSIGGEDVATVGPGGFFGELSLLDGEPRVATVTATTDMQLIVMSRHEFNELLAQMPLVSRRILREIGGRLRAADARLALSA
jgi:CRP/FNR family transcriptional regulator, cyclic AMP receptor protein